MAPCKDRADRWVDKGDAAFLRGDYDGSISWFTEAIGLYDAEPDFFAKRATAYSCDKQFVKACEDYRRALDVLGMPNTEYLVESARCHLALGGYDDALLDLKTALSIDSKNASALRLKTKAQSMYRCLDQYHASVEEERYPSAISALTAACDLCEGGAPGNWCNWLLRLIQFDLERGMDLDSASQAASGVVSRAPGSVDALALLALISFLSDDFSQSFSLLNRALQLRPHHRNVNVLYQRVKATEQAKRAGHEMFRQSRFKEALLDYKEALKIVGKDIKEARGGLIRAKLLSKCGLTLLQLNRYTEALDYVGDSLQLFPRSFTTLLTEAQIYQAQGNYQAAVNGWTDAFNVASTSGRRDFALEKLEAAKLLLLRSKSMNCDRRGYYKLLGIPTTCSAEALKKAYHQRCRETHGDTANGDAELFKSVLAAHAVLSDPERRARYDQGMDEDGHMASQERSDMRYD